MRFHSFDPGIEAVSLVKNELHKQAAPRRMIFQILVKFGSHGAQLRQIIPRYRGQIMMLIVITHVQRQPVNRSIITKRLLVKIVRVVLLNPARAYRVQADRKEKCGHEIKKSSPTAEIDDRYIVQDRTREVGGEPAVPHLDRL